MEASIQQVARLTGTTSRTLRHYHRIGLLVPSRVGDNGYRWYDDDALVRLQRILLLRETGMGLAEIGRVLDRETDEVTALRRHLAHPGPRVGTRGDVLRDQCAKALTQPASPLHHSPPGPSCDRRSTRARSDRT